ncbi:MAG: 2,3-bisphosphoglycerate-independent phosphoglycerate mutase, partial [Proteobacteria bacterium]|nr:2,3-bisphosphoglycerate-independent phosphoglycerate mutase [Pseudomonadota bacterium]
MINNSAPRPVVLCILDGWGERDDRENNAIAQATTPVWDRLKATAPHSRLDASERHVGLPDDQMGNSEVGHMNLGAGRVVAQDLPRIDAAIADGSLAANKSLAAFIGAVKQKTGRVHLAGLLGTGGVHSHQSHLIGLVRILKSAGVSVTMHLFLDGRDTPPKSAKAYLQDFVSQLPDIDIG